jgi:predicted nuclease of predicted toxin-antitoxin system
MVVVLDTCVYLRLAKRIRPFLGKEFGQKNYVLKVLQVVEKEVKRNSTLSFKNPWFDENEFFVERDSHSMRMSPQEKIDMPLIKSIFNGYIVEHLNDFMIGGRSPPGSADCEVLTFASMRNAIVVTDDIGLHKLAIAFKIPVWHGYELLSKLFAAKVIDSNLIREIFDALERNNDLTQTWEEAKYSKFKKVFGNKKEAS